MKEKRTRGGVDRDGDLGRYEVKGQWALRNMKDKDGEWDGFRGKRKERAMREIWSNKKAEGNMNITLCGSVMWKGQKERK